MNPYCIVLTDDHVLLRQGLRGIIERRPDLKVIGEAGDGIELLGLLKQLTAHLVILDISMPNLRGIEAVREIKMIDPDLKILILTMHKDAEYLHQAMSAGADGYLLKEDADTELFSAIDRIREGKIYVSPSFKEYILEEWSRSHRSDYRPTFQPDHLTPRERQVLKLIAEGKTSREIAELLFVSVRTAEHHRTNIMDKLNLRRTADLVQYAIRKGYL